MALLKVFMHITQQIKIQNQDARIFLHLTVGTKVALCMQSFALLIFLVFREIVPIGTILKIKTGKFFSDLKLINYFSYRSE